MGPKTAASKAPETLEVVISVLKSLSAKFNTFSTKLTSVETLSKQVKAMDAKIASLEAKLMDVLEANKTLPQGSRSSRCLLLSLARLVSLATPARWRRDRG
jgi:hypothetical protein